MAKVDHCGRIAVHEEWFEVACVVLLIHSAANCPLHAHLHEFLLCRGAGHADNFKQVLFAEHLQKSAKGESTSNLGLNGFQNLFKEVCAEEFPTTDPV